MRMTRGNEMNKELERLDRMFKIALWVMIGGWLVLGVMGVLLPMHPVLP